jgi:hypothetical protein
MKCKICSEVNMKDTKYSTLCGVLLVQPNINKFVSEE